MGELLDRLHALHKERQARFWPPRPARCVIPDLPLVVVEPEPAPVLVVLPPPMPIVNVYNIIRFVARRYAVPFSDMTSHKRFKNISEPRQIAMYLAKKIVRASLPAIGRRLGGRDHTTILHGIRRVTARVASDPAFAAQMDRLREDFLAIYGPRA